jgi:hypothetical protein
VERGVFVWELDFIAAWDEDIEKMNIGKKGRPYEFPDSLFIFCCRVRATSNMQLRMMEGMLRDLLGAFGRVAPDHSTIEERCSALRWGYPERAYEEHGNAGVDSTCINVTNRGEWLRHNYDLKRGFFKLHLVSDLAANMILAHRVTDEHTGDPRMLLPLIDDTIANGFHPDKVLGDAGYDAWYNWQGLVIDRKIKDTVINLKSSDVHANGCLYKGQMIDERNEVGQAQWKENHGYGERWRCECTNSDFKRLMGQFVYSRNFKRIENEIDCKVQVFNGLKKLRGQ